MTPVRFQGKPFDITVIQVYAYICNLKTGTDASICRAGADTQVTGTCS